MDTSNPSANEEGGGAGAARPGNSSGSGGFGPVALPEFSIPMEAPLAVEQSSVPLAGMGGCATGAAQIVSSIVPGGPGTSALPAFSFDILPAPTRPKFFRTMEAPLAGTRTGGATRATLPDGLRAPPVSDTTTTPTALEESTLRLASGLEHMNLTGREPPAVERPSVSTMKARKRTPGRWRRIPRMWNPPEHTPEVRAKMDKGDLTTLKNIEFIKSMREQDCHLVTKQDKLDFHAFKEKMIQSLSLIVNSKPKNTFFTYKRFSDTKEEHLTAEGMEGHILAQFPDRKPCHQAKHFAELALKHYNQKKTESRKFKLATTLLSNCFSECSGTTYGHVNFTAILEEKTAAQPTSRTKRLFFAELMLIPELQLYPNEEPMRVVHVYMIDEDYCYGGCNKIFRKINHKMRREMDYERCHACSDLIKHPKGQLFGGGHNSSRLPYSSAV